MGGLSLTPALSTAVLSPGWVTPSFRMEGWYPGAGVVLETQDDLETRGRGVTFLKKVLFVSSRGLGKALVAAF